ncbi:RHS repeat domain-containing protein [Pseudomonas asiatica]|nr:RHS repeat domain-containing protein [Pseudomonas asiatica]MDZ5750996.1 RHS repeat domain-containing protein [Pseudomonas asiatica]MDZ5756009.1 RHS repeat domain-containing protein [Pseudomonas asiatica]
MTPDGTLGYEYDPLGNLTTLTLPDGRKVNHLLFTDDGEEFANRVELCAGALTEEIYWENAIASAAFFIRKSQRYVMPGEAQAIAYRHRSPFAALIRVATLVL